MKSKIAVLVISIGFIGASVNAADLFNGKYECWLGSYVRPHAWQTMTKELDIVDNFGSLKMQIGDVIATVEANEWHGELVDAQLEDTKSGIRSTSTAILGTRLLSTDLYNDKETLDVVSGQLQCTLKQ